MQKFEDCFFVAFDKTPIHYRVLETPAERVASVLIVHGAGEYPARYDDFAGFLGRKGLAVYAIGLRGHGKSGGDRAYVSHFSDFTKDCLALLAKIGGDSPRPVLVLGHSMGGLIAAAVAAEPAANLSGAVLSSPFFGLAMKLPRYLRIAASVTAGFYPHFTQPSVVPSELLTHDAEMVNRHRTDPNITRVMTSGLFAGMVRTAARYVEMGRAISCPVLVAQAGDDRIVDPAASRRFLEAVANPDKEYKLYAGLYHEILNETSRDAVYDDIWQWIRKHIVS